MKKGILLTIFSVLPLAALATSLVVMQNKEVSPQYAAQEYSMTLDSSVEVVAKDEGNYFEAEVKSNKFDVLGYQDFDGGFASIKKQAYGDYEYNGMIYNRSIINGFASLSVNFNEDDGDLYYVFSEFLMEDMHFDKANKLESNKKVNAPLGSGYFIVYTDSVNPIGVKELTVSYLCDQSLDNTMIYNEQNIDRYARSTPKSTTFYNDSFEFTNRPDKDINNYSSGKYGTSGNNKSWYRWNGRASTTDVEVGTSFAIDTTIMGNISQVINPNSYFNFSMWIRVAYDDGVNKEDNWEYVYIGNDNYEPLGSENRILPQTDHNADYSYPGRFFNGYFYDEEANNWVFPDPEVMKVADGSMTFKEAYEAFTLPYWHLSYRVDNGFFACYVNGIRIYEEEIFENYDGQSLYIDEIHFHAVNYGAGIDMAGTPYNAFYTYPRITTPCPQDLNEVYLRGADLSNWAPMYKYKFTETSENRGELHKVHLEENGIYKIGNADWSEDYGYSDFGDSDAFTYFSGGEDDNFLCNKTGDYNIYINGGKVYIYRDINSVPLYLRGSFNSWETDDELDPSADPNNVGELLNVVLHAGEEFKIAEDDWTGKFVYGYESLNPACESYANFSDYGGNIHCNVSGAYNLYLTTNGYIYITAGDAFYIEQESLTLTKGHTATIHYGNNAGNVSVSGDNTVASWSVDSENKTISFTALKGATDEPYQVFDGSETLYLSLNVNVPEPTKYGIRGSYNSWGAFDEDHTLVVSEGNKGEICYVYLDVGEFKIADNSWGEAYGWYDLEGKPDGCFSQSGENIKCDVAGYYDIYLNNSNKIYIVAH